VSEELLVFFSMAMNLVVTMINLIIIVPIIKLATADVYRRLEERLAGATAQDLSDMQAMAGEVGAAEGG
jgi:uncharacterized membrane protein